jgi:hypothetical protein
VNRMKKKKRAARVGGDVRTILEQHRTMRAAVKELRDFLRSPRPAVKAATSHPWARAMAGKVMRLHDLVFRHFRVEEQAGFVEDLSTKHPQSIRSYRALWRDHDRILADLRAILGAAMVYSEGKLPDNPQLRRWTLSVLDHLAQHEYQETELLQSVVYRDTGAAD